jgi:hypothetical protein
MCVATVVGLITRSLAIAFWLRPSASRGEELVLPLCEVEPSRTPWPHRKALKAPLDSSQQNIGVRPIGVQDSFAPAELVSVVFPTEPCRRLLDALLKRQHALTLLSRAVGVVRQW